MSQAPIADETVRLHVENIGGIDETTLEFSPGVTILTGRNATNRTSLLQALIAVIGGDSASVKADADEGRVELTVGETTYTRRLERQGNAVVTSGDPYLEDATLASLFAFLLETNDARQAVTRGDDLRDIIMEPIDTTEIEDQIGDLQNEKEKIGSQIEELSSLKLNLPDIEGRRAEIEDEIDEKKNELASIEEQIDDVDEDVAERKEEKQVFESKLGELNDIRGELESVRQQLDSQRDSLDALLTEREELRDDREDYEGIPEGRLDGVESEIQRLRERKSRVESTINEIQTVVQFNEGLLDGSIDVFSDLEDEGADDVTAQLLDDGEEVVCWTCGGEVDTEQIEAMLSRLRELRNEKMDRRNEIDADIDELNDERIRLEEKHRQREQIERRLERVADEIDEREGRIEELEERKADLTDQVEELEAEVEELQTETQRETELLELHKEANRLEVEIERLESDRDEIEARIEDIESRLAEREELEARREELQSEIEDLRVRVERTEQGAVDRFNEHMASILDILEYDNLERIWIERTEEEVREGRRTVTKGRFDLHIVRSTDSGTVYEDTIDHLSESEREVTGLVFALAGYLVHDVHEAVPFILLDSLEAIDAPRLAELVHYFEDHADHLVVALLEEDAQALDDDYQRITSI